jgi:Flp pilus assembly protein TadD
MAAARTHVWAAGDSPESLMLLGFALHYARDFVAAETAFDSARALSDPDDRRRLDDLRVLLDPSE